MSKFAALRVFVNAAVTEGVERREALGKQWVVSPVIAVRSMVLNGNFLTKEAIQKSVRAWEEIPLTIGHPPDELRENAEAQDQWIQANTVGYFRNVHLKDGDQLAGEIWLDVTNASEPIQAIADALEGGATIEVSTGYLAFVEPIEGEIDGQKFNAIQHRILPNHLALLPTEIGACSVKDGCGTPRLNQAEIVELVTNVARKALREKQAANTPEKKDSAQPDDRKPTQVNNGKRVAAVMKALIESQSGNATERNAMIDRLATAADVPNAKVKQILAGRVDFVPDNWVMSFAATLNVEPHLIFRAIRADIEDFLDDIEPNSPDEFQPALLTRVSQAVEGAVTKALNFLRGEKPMTKEQLIEQIAKNRNMSDEQRKELEPLSECVLLKFLSNEESTTKEPKEPKQVANTQEPKEPAEPKEEPKPAAAAEPKAVENAKAPELTWDQVLKVMPPEMKANLDRIQNEGKSAREKLVAEAKANKSRHGLSDEEIEAASDAVLIALNKANPKPRSYAGAAGGVPAANAAEKAIDFLSSVPTPMTNHKKAEQVQ